MAVEDLDDMLEHVGGFGRFQKILIVASFPFNLLFPYLFYNQVFFALTPKHWCLVPELSHLPLDTRMEMAIPIEVHQGVDKYSKCRMYNLNYTEVLSNQEAFANHTSTPTVTCQHGWEYDTSHYYSTVVSEYDWVCEDNWRASAGQTVCFLGSILGTLVFGWAADAWGRLPCLIASNLLACASGFATAFVTGFATFATCRFLSGLTLGTFHSMVYLILQEYVSADKRSLAANLPIATFLTVGLMTLPWIAYAVWNWRHLALILSAPFIFVVIAPWVIPESGRWLLSKGRAKEAEKILRHVAKTNKNPVSERVFEEFRVAAHKIGEEKNQQQSSYLDLFRTPVLRKRVFVMCGYWMTTLLCYDGHMRNLENMEYNIYWTFTIAGALEFPADMLTILTLEWIGRRWTSSLSLLLSGITYLSVILVPAGHTIASTCMAMLGRFFITMTLNVITQYTLELLPTLLRAQGNSLLIVVASVATSFSPYVVYLGTKSSFLPFLILGLVAMAGGVLCLFLPESMNEPLPNTVTEAENMGASQPFCHFPCCQSDVGDERISYKPSENGERDGGAATKVEDDAESTLLPSSKCSPNQLQV